MNESPAILEFYNMDGAPGNCQFIPGNYKLSPLKARTGMEVLELIIWNPKSKILINSKPITQ
jgi:hypothetical protein